MVSMSIWIVPLRWRMRMGHRTRVAVLLLVCVCAARAHLANADQSPQEDALTREMNDAIEQVKRIINDPVPALPLTPEAQVSKFSPGWFHSGSIKPRFLTVDVRTTQEFPYDRFEYVTSDLNPGLMFRGKDLEFNGMMKYFYTDRTVPKKRLGEAEMVEINRLYRIIGRCEMELARLRSLPTAAGSATPPTGSGVPIAAGTLVLILAALIYRVRSRRARHHA